MHPFSLPEDLVARVKARTGRAHPFDVMDPARTALVVVDMQNYFVKEGFMGEVPMARTVTGAINRLAAGLRARGGTVAWVKNTAIGTLDAWSVFNTNLMTPDRRDRRFAEQHVDHEGHQVYGALEVAPGDLHIVKRRLSAFIQGSSDIAEVLRARGVDTVLIAGTATNVCCESSARDAMMLNFKTVMVSDALATFTDEEHAASLRAFYAIFGDVQTVDQALGALDAGGAAAVAAE